MRKRIVAANWKMHGTYKEVHSYIGALGSPKFRREEETELHAFSDAHNPPEVIICFPYLYLRDAVCFAPGRFFHVGAQNFFYEDQGAYTGEISAPMLADTGVTHVIIGHSERRDLFGETDEIVHKKMQAALAHKLTPILCVGESLELREAGEERAMDFVQKQLSIALEGVTPAQMANMVIAYEPIWAIGTGKTASAEQAQAMCKSIRDYIVAIAGQETGDAIRILYGGSVNTDNIFTFVREEDIDGALVGGASLSAEKFDLIIERCNTMYES